MYLAKYVFAKLRIFLKPTNIFQKIFKKNRFFSEKKSNSQPRHPQNAAFAYEPPRRN